MGAARAALGATILPSPIDEPSEEEYTTSSPRNQGYYRPTGEIGAARAALGATINQAKKNILRRAVRAIKATTDQPVR
ncbi:hypothetical protein ACHAPG_011616 [Botrytis cinerea]